MIGDWKGTAYSLNLYRDRVEVLATPATRAAERIASIPVSYAAPNPPPYLPETWTHLSSAGLTLLVGPAGEQSRLYQIDLATGTVKDLGVLGPPPVRLSLDVSYDGRYLAEKRLGIAHPLEMIDLSTGQRTSFGDDAIPMGGLWSPTDLTVAVRAAEPGSDLPAQIGAMYADGGTHIDLIRTNGSSRRLSPPQSLQLTRGPVWSPGGKWLAVYSGSILPVGKGPDGASVFQSRFVWLVEAATNQWIYAGEVDANSNLTQWSGKWSTWLTEMAARPKFGSGEPATAESITQIRKRMPLSIYLPAHIPAGLKLAPIDAPQGGDWVWISFVDSSGAVALKITERPVNGHAPGYIPHQYLDLPEARTDGSKTAARVACRTQGECTVAWIAPDPYIQVETAFGLAMTQADLLRLVDSLSPSATEEQIAYDLAPLGKIAP